MLPFVNKQNQGSSLAARFKRPTIKKTQISVNGSINLCVIPLEKWQQSRHTVKSIGNIQIVLDHIHSVATVAYAGLLGRRYSTEQHRKFTGYIQKGTLESGKEAKGRYS